MRKREKNGAFKRKTKIANFKLKFLKFGVDFISRVWYYN